MIKVIVHDRFKTDNRKVLHTKSSEFILNHEEMFSCYYTVKGLKIVIWEIVVSASLFNKSNVKFYIHSFIWHFPLSLTLWRWAPCVCGSLHTTICPLFTAIYFRITWKSKRNVTSICIFIIINIYIAPFFEITLYSKSWTTHCYVPHLYMDKPWRSHS